jgi:hypothetical protein
VKPHQNYINRSSYRKSGSNQRSFSYYSNSAKRNGRVRHYSEAAIPKYGSKQLSKSQKNLFKGLLKTLKIFALPSALIVAVILISQLSFFKIKNVNIEGIKTLNEDEVKSMVDKHISEENRMIFFPQNNYFFVNTEDVESNLSRKFPLNFVKVNRVFPNGLDIELEEKISTVVFTNGEEYELLDLNGDYLKPLTIIINQNSPAANSISSSTTSGSAVSSTIVSNINDKQNESSTVIGISNIGREFQGLPIIYTKNQKIFANKGLGVIPKQTVGAAIDIKNMVEKQKIGYIKYFTIDDSNSSNLEATTNFSWKILFNAKNNFQNQINNLKLVTKENSPKEYVDVRYDGRVYYK